MAGRRMNAESRQSFTRAFRAEISGHGQFWYITLIVIFERWLINGGGNTPLAYSSAQTAAQAIKRVRPDLPWTVIEHKPEKTTESNTEAHKLISCPSCSVNIRIPTPIPNAIILCKRCRARLSIKQDIHGAIHITLLIKENPKEESDNSLPITKEDAAKILEVSVNDDPATIKKAWRSLLGQYHPDKLFQMGDKLKTVAEIESKRINRAYKILSRK